MVESSFEERGKSLSLVIVEFWMCFHALPTESRNSVIPVKLSMYIHCTRTVRSGLKVAEHSFQVPMSNSPQLLNYSCFGAHFLQESRLITEVFILTF